MAAKHTNLYLYLALACFLGIVAIFVGVGYLGVYDTIYLTTGEREQRVDPDFWLRPDSVWSIGIGEGGKLPYRYEIENRRFTGYTAEVSVSVWRSQQKVKDLVTRAVTLEPFGKTLLTGEVETQDLRPASIPPEQGYEFTLLFQRGQMERRIIVFANPRSPSGIPVKPIPAPPVPVR